MEKIIHVAVTPESTEADPCSIYNRAFYSYMKAAEYLEEIETKAGCRLRIVAMPLDEYRGLGVIET